MHLEFEGHHFAWHYDSLYGVGRFERKFDGALSPLETGTDCQDVRRGLRRMHQKTHANRYPFAAPRFADLMDSVASEYPFELE